MTAKFRVPVCPKLGLTKTFIDGLPPAPSGSYTIIDNDTPHLRLRVSDTGAKTFFMWKRWEKGASSATARSIGAWGVVSLADARKTAREWEDLRKKGTDPKVLAEEERRAAEVAREAEEARREVTFGVVMERYLAAKRNKGRRKVAEDEADFRRDCLPLWKDKAITAIGKRDVEKLVERILERGRREGARTDRTRHAHNVLTKVKALFNWAVKKELVDRSPCRLIDAEELIGERRVRDRHFSPDELFAFLRAVRRMPYPYGPMYHLLALTGARLREISEASWPEVDLAKGTLTVPATRFKSKRDNVIALSGDAVALLAELPRWEPVKGDPRHFLFSAFAGSAPVNGMNKSKRRLDARMVRTLRALTRKRGGDDLNVTLPDWQIHDLRRVVRSGMSELRVPPVIAELVIGHTLPALWGTYDKFTYLEEKREALEKWAAHLRGVGSGDPEEADPPANVVQFRREVARA